MPRARFGALSAVDAFFIIDDGQIILHCDCALGTGAYTFAAGNTAIFAGIHHGFAPFMRRAGDIYPGICGDAHEELLGTGEDARTA